MHTTRRLLVVLLATGSLLAARPALADDADSDGLDDAWEEQWFDGLQSGADDDPDGDGLTNVGEQDALTSPLAFDTDGDLLSDGVEVHELGTKPTKVDTDGDSLSDQVEAVQLGTNPLKSDTDGDGLSDAADVAAGCDPLLADTDADGLSDGEEVSTTKTSPVAPDTDADALLDGAEVTLHGTDPLAADSDYDGLPDGVEVGAGTSALLADSDGGGVLDAVELWEGLDPLQGADEDGLDADDDGLSSAYEANVTLSDPALADTDGDGAPDGEEAFALANRLVTMVLDADTDDDGLLDGAEVGVAMPEGTVGGTSPVAVDTDGDGIADGIEVGLTTPQVSAADPDATDPARFVADADPTTKTNPVKVSTDTDGVSDGLEDRNHNGRWDSALGDVYWPSGETNPLKIDTDGDQMFDNFEIAYADPAIGVGAPLNPLDPFDGPLDPDDDGLTNLEESLVKRLQPDGTSVFNRTHPRKADTDSDGLLDGVEVHSAYEGFAQGTDPKKADTDGDGLVDSKEDADHDGALDPGETHPLVFDSDGDALADGKEDADHDGVRDPTESDPLVFDTDGDGLGDGEEVQTFKTSPVTADTDGDGLADGLEVGRQGDADPATTTNPKKADTDGDGLTDGAEDVDADGALAASVTDPGRLDSDGDGLGDGLESGLANDADVATTTNPLVADTDGDGLTDGQEDSDHDGAVDPTESNPQVVDTDGGGSSDGAEVLVDGTDPVNPIDDGAADPDDDGLTTSLEWTCETDPLDPDTDGDAIPDGTEVGDDPALPRDSDDDGVLDALDLDSDDDGVEDLQEGGDDDLATAPTDTDSDDLPDYRDDDSDADGISDAHEAAVDATLDGVPDPDVDGDDLSNRVDPDSDGDGELDLDEGEGDADGDGIPNWVDAHDDLPPEPDTHETMPEVAEVLPDLADVAADAPDAAETKPEALDDVEPPPDAVEAAPDLADVAADPAETTPDAAGDDDATAPAIRGTLQGGVVCTAGPTSAGAGWQVPLVLALLALLAARRRRRGLPIALAAWSLALGASGPGRAADGPEVFSAHPFSMRGGSGAVSTTATGRVLGHLQLEAGLSAGWMGRTVLEVASSSVSRTWLGHRVGGELYGRLGLFDRFEVGLGLPVVAWQDASLLSGARATRGGLGELVLVPAVRLLDEQHGHALTLAFLAAVSIPLHARDAYLTNGFEAAPRIALSRRVGSFVFASNAWYRFLADDRRVANVRLDDQVGVALAAGWRGQALPVDVDLDATLAVPVLRPFAHAEETFSEASAGVAWRLGDWRLRLVAAKGLTSGLGMPAARVLAALEWSPEPPAPPAPAEPEPAVAEAPAAPPPAPAAPPAPEPQVPAEPPAPPPAPADDRDHDGLADADDACPTEPEDRDGVQDDDGCPDRDNDLDGVPDDRDRCPAEAETTNGVDDDDGCPDTAPASRDDGPESLDLLRGRVLFQRGSAILDTRGYVFLDRLARLLRQRGTARLVVSGHASLCGPDALNEPLSRWRAEAVRDALVARGVPADRLEARGLGTSQPAVSGTTPEAHAANQRVEFDLEETK